MKNIFDHTKKGLRSRTQTCLNQWRAVMNPEMRQFPSDIMTMAELKEYLELKKKIFALTPFVELDLNNPDEKRYEELNPKYIALRKFIRQNYK